jgi:hypothetical protein
MFEELIYEARKIPVINSATTVENLIKRLFPKLEFYIEIDDDITSTMMFAFDVKLNGKDIEDIFGSEGYHVYLDKRLDIGPLFTFAFDAEGRIYIALRKKGTGGPYLGVFSTTANENLSLIRNLFKQSSIVEKIQIKKDFDKNVQLFTEFGFEQTTVVQNYVVMNKSITDKDGRLFRTMLHISRKFGCLDQIDTFDVSRDHASRIIVGRGLEMNHDMFTKILKHIEEKNKVDILTEAVRLPKLSDMEDVASYLKKKLSNEPHLFVSGPSDDGVAIWLTHKKNSHSAIYKIVILDRQYDRFDNQTGDMRTTSGISNKKSTLKKFESIEMALWLNKIIKDAKIVSRTFEQLIKKIDLIFEDSPYVLKYGTIMENIHKGGLQVLYDGRIILTGSFFPVLTGTSCIMAMYVRSVQTNFFSGILNNEEEILELFDDIKKYYVE